MHINFNTEDLSTEDIKVLAAIVAAHGGETPTQVVNNVVSQAAPEPEKPKRTRRTKAQIEADEAAAAEEEETPANTPDPEPESVDDEDGDKEDGNDLQKAVEKATELVSSGQAGAVKEALASVGVKKVSELKKAADIKAFLEALD